MSDTIDQRTARQIVDTVKDVCGHDINFINEQGIITASTNPERVGTFHEIGRQVIQTGRTVEVTEDHGFCGTQKGVNIPIVHNGSAAAAIGISGEPKEVRKYAYLMQKIAALILKEHDLELQNNSRKSRMNYIIRTLVHGAALPRGYLEEFLKEYSLGRDQLFYTVLIELKPQWNMDNLFSLEQRIYQTFEAAGSSLYTFDYPNEYVLFLDEESGRRSWPLLERLAARQNGILKLARGSLQPLSRQNLSYEAARLTIKGLEGKRYAAVYEELGLELLLGSVPENARGLFLERVLGKLKPEDRELLRIYFEEDQSLVRTSSRLSLHKNTLQYRLDRIFRECGYNPRSFQDAAVLYSALKLSAM